MITEDRLFNDSKYKFKNLSIEVLEKDETGNVHAFAATYVMTSLDDRISDGLIDVNKLWDQGSPKRPPGYIVYSALDDGQGRAKSIMISEEFFDEQRGKLKEWREKWAGDWKIVK